MRKMTRIKKKLENTKKVWKPKEDKQWKLIQEYSKYDFNYQSVIRIKNNSDYQEHYTKVYNNKISSNYVDSLMDRLVKRKSITGVIAFIEQDDYHNNHLHFAWYCPVELTREQLSSTMRINIKHIINVEPIDGVEAAIGYYTKRTETTNSFHNIYA